MAPQRQAPENLPQDELRMSTYAVAHAFYEHYEIYVGVGRSDELNLA